MALRLLIDDDEVRRFSALQRAENSSIPSAALVRLRLYVFQCSSASRKFLNVDVSRWNWVEFEFQCSSASRKFLNFDQFQSASPRLGVRVSVLFSEPKIPQFARLPQMLFPPAGFSALQRAENSSIQQARGRG